MFVRFCGFGLGHISMHHLTKVFQVEIEEAFGLGPNKDDVEENFEATQPTEGDYDGSEHVGEKGFEDKSDGDSELDDNSEGSEVDLWDHGDDLDYLAFEEDSELGYAPL